MQVKTNKQNNMPEENSPGPEHVHGHPLVFFCVFFFSRRCILPRRTWPRSECFPLSSLLVPPAAAAAKPAASRQTLMRFSARKQPAFQTDCGITKMCCHSAALCSFLSFCRSFGTTRGRYMCVHISFRLQLDCERKVFQVSLLPSSVCVPICGNQSPFAHQSGVKVTLLVAHGIFPRQRLCFPSKTRWNAFYADLSCLVAGSSYLLLPVNKVKKSLRAWGNFYVI